MKGWFKMPNILSMVRLTDAEKREIKELMCKCANTKDVKACTAEMFGLVELICIDALQLKKDGS